MSNTTKSQQQVIFIQNHFSTNGDDNKETDDDRINTEQQINDGLNEIEEKIVKMKNKLISFTEELKIDSQIRKLQKLNSQLKLKVNDLENDFQKLNQKEKEFKDLNIELKKKRKEINDSTNKLNSKENRIKFILKEYIQLVKDKDKLNQQLNDKIKLIQEKENEIIQNKEKNTIFIKELQNNFNQKEKEVKRWNIELIQQQRIAEDLNIKLNESLIKINEKDKLNKEQMDKISDLTITIEENKENKEKLQQKLKQKSQIIDENEEEIKNLNHGLNQKQDDIKLKDKKINYLYLIGFILLLLLILSVYINYIGVSYRSDNLLENNNLKDTLKQTKKDYDDLNDKYSEILNAQNSITSEYEQLNIELKDLQQIKKESALKFDQCTEDINTKNSYYSELYQKHKVLTEKNEELTRNYKLLEQDVIDVNEKYEGCTVDKEYIEMQIAQKNKLIKLLQEQINDKKQYLEEYHTGK